MIQTFCSVNTIISFQYKNGRWDVRKTQVDHDQFAVYCKLFKICFILYLKKHDWYLKYFHHQKKKKSP